MLSRIIKYLTVGLCALLLGISVFLLWVSYRYTVPVLMYHSIADSDEHLSDTVSPENFEKHMRFFEKYNYNVIGLDELVEGIKSDKEFPRNTVVITFDDGYLNNYTHAFPVLEKYGFDALFFVPYYDIGRDGFMTKEQIEEMMAQGHVFGSHTLSHKYLPDLSFEDKQKEIIQSKVALEYLFKESFDFFAYPVGGFDEDSKNLVEEAGYTAAVATNRGYDTRNRDVYEINRIKMSNKDTNDFLVFWKVTGYYTVLKSPKHPY